jgi:hypothetical protein
MPRKLLSIKEVKLLGYWLGNIFPEVSSEPLTERQVFPSCAGSLIILIHLTRSRFRFSVARHVEHEKKNDEGERFGSAARRIQALDLDPLAADAAHNDPNDFTAFFHHFDVRARSTGRDH